MGFSKTNFNPEILYRTSLMNFVHDILEVTKNFVRDCNDTVPVMHVKSATIDHTVITITFPEAQFHPLMQNIVD